MKNGKYETALTDYIPANVKEWQPIHVELLTAAGTIDRLTADIIRDSKNLSTPVSNRSTLAPSSSTSTTSAASSISATTETLS